MDIDPNDFLDDLASVRWYVAAKTYGSHHATLIGLLVDWWVSRCPEENWTLEGGPSNGYSEVGMRGQCDALFCRNDIPVGVLEVEGSRKIETAVKIGSYFDAVYEEYSKLKFGLLVLYSYEPYGKGENRVFDTAVNPDVVKAIESVSGKHFDKPFYVISIDKAYNNISDGVRSFNEYYKGSIKNISAHCFLGGKNIMDRNLYDAS